MGVVGFVWLLASPDPLEAAEDDEPRNWFAGVGADVWLGGATGGHGYTQLQWRWYGLSDSGRLDLVWLTDTLEVRASQLELSEYFHLDASLKGQYPFGRLLPDYYREGRRQPAREFYAGYLRADVTLEVSDGQRHFLKLSARGRKWWFQRVDRTGANLTLPDDPWVFEPRLSYTYWHVERDRSQWQPHHPFPRTRGVAFGASIGADWRTETDEWGARTRPFSPLDARNEPDAPIITARQWFELGWPRSTPFYVHWTERAAWGQHEDDLTRRRLGGLNPWVVPIAGLPWGSLVSGRYVTSQFGLRWAGWNDHELGIFVDGGAVADIRRTGDLDDFGPAAGAGMLADLRFGPWKVDTRLGWAYPFSWLEARPSLSFWVSTGRTW